MCVHSLVPSAWKYKTNNSALGIFAFSITEYSLVYRPRVWEKWNSPSPSPEAPFEVLHELIPKMQNFWLFYKPRELNLLHKFWTLRRSRAQERERREAPSANNSCIFWIRSWTALDRCMSHHWVLHPLIVTYSLHYTGYSNHNHFRVWDLGWDWDI